MGLIVKSGFGASLELGVWSLVLFTSSFPCSGQGASPPVSPPAIQPVVEVEEEVYQYEPANNGAGPLWCGGSTCLVRIGNEIFASGLETLKDRKPLNNCRWLLFKREENG